jgi:O-antigen ligase
LSPTLAGYSALRWLLAVGVYLSLAQGDLLLERWVQVFLVGLGLQAIVGLGQVIHQGPLGLPGELALEPARSGAAILTVGGRRWLRAYGLTLHPNVLGGFLAIGLVLGLPLLKRFRMRILWWLLGLGLLVSFSRSAWLATALVLPPVAGWLAWRRPSLRRPLGTTLASAALVALIGGVLFAGQFASRLGRTATVTESRSLSERGELIAIALDVITNRPLTGVGAGNFPLAVAATDTPALPQPVHNVPLLLAAEVGVLGGGLWIWLWLTPGLALQHFWRRHAPWMVILIGAWFALGTISLWDSYPWALNAGRLLTATVLGLTSRALTAGRLDTPQ